MLLFIHYGGHNEIMNSDMLDGEATKRKSVRKGSVRMGGNVVIDLQG